MSTNDFSKFLVHISNEPLFVIDPQIAFLDYTKLDLSIHNEDLKAIDVSNVEALDGYIEHVIKISQSNVAFGGYLEERAIYDRSTNFKTDSLESARTIHLGMDLWLEAGSVIYAPLEGIVHSFENNMKFGDYGPTIILEHQVGDFQFFTLYGHLSLESLDKIYLGKKIQKGEAIATLGTSVVNGNYPPHLHFQVIKELQGMKGDYPGVCNRENLKYYRTNCPDPNLLLKIQSY